MHRMCSISKRQSASGESPNTVTVYNKSAAHKKAPLKTVGLFYNMARLEGFEPPTAWFVARYSIQLSYRR